MKINLFGGIVLSLVSSAISQDKFNVAESINKFSVDLLAGVNIEGGNNLNVALSPFTIWTMLSVISEGAYDATADQLDAALRQPQNKNGVRSSYGVLSNLLRQNSDQAEFEASTGIFSRIEFPVKQKFEQIIKQYYSAAVTSVDFKNKDAAVKAINEYVAKATRNRITTLVNQADVEDAYLFITSTMFFKGQWQVPFNKSATKLDAFYDDKRMRIGEVQMMYQAHPFPYARLNRIKADAVELKYGSNNKFSMLVLVPRGGQTVTNMLNALTRESITDILENLQRNSQKFTEDDIHVYLPKFKYSSDFNLDRILYRLGIRDVFDPQKANLLGIFPHYLFLSRVIQKAEIEVDEEGTVAAAAAGSIFLNRAPPPVVIANRPFAYFIIHKESGSIIFAGKISNPNTL